MWLNNHGILATQEKDRAINTSKKRHGGLKEQTKFLAVESQVFQLSSQKSKPGKN